MRIRLKTLLLPLVVVCLVTVVSSARVAQPAPGAWLTLGSTLAARNAAAAAVLANGRVLVTGGRTSAGITATAEIFDPASGTSTAVPDMPTPRANHTATLLADGRVLVAGGVQSDDPKVSSATADIYDPYGDAWSTVWMNDARAHHTASILGDGRVLVAGGDAADVPVATVEIFDPIDWSFSLAGSLSVARTRHAAAVMRDGKVLIAGGVSADGVLASTDIFDPETGAITAGPSMTSARARFTATTLITGDVVMAGGTDGTDVLTSAERLAYGASEFIPAGNMTTARAGHVAIRMPANGGVLMAGGGTTAEPSASAEVFLPKSGFFLPTGATETGHVGATATELLTPGAVLVAGGYGNASAEAYGYATLATDKDDYAPGTTVTITGSGWEPNETVTLLLEEETPIHGMRSLTATADASGNFTNTDFSPEEHHIGVRFFLTAYGAKSEAQVTFTDGNATVSGTVRSSAAGNPVISGATVSCATPSCVAAVQTTTAANGSYSLPVNFQGNDATLSLTATAPGYAPSTLTVFAANPGTTSPTLNFTLTPVSKTTPTITFGAAPTPTFGGSNFTVTATTSNTDNTSLSFSKVSGPCSLSSSTANSATFSSSGAGACVVKADGAATTNFNAATAQQTVTIGKANATINVSGFSGPYDGTAHGATGTATGVGGADLSASLNLGATFTNVPGGTAHWTFTGGANYNDASGDVAIAIGKADATVSVTGYSVTYDGDPHTATGTATGVNGESLSGLDLSGTEHTNAGSYTDTWTFTDVTGNYNNASDSVSDVIAKADATVSVNGYTGTYDGDSHGASGSATGVDNVDLFEQLSLGESFTDVPGGTAHWSFDGGPNYNDQSGSVEIKISKADATIHVTGYNVTYDGNEHTASATAVGVKGESLLAGLNLSGTAHTNAGTYSNDPWTFSGGTNYNDANGTVNDAIAKANATILVTPYDVTYDRSPHTATGTATGVKGESLTGLNLSGTTHTAAGTYNGDGWTFTDVTGNYNNASGSVNDKINQRPVTGSFQALSKPFDGNTTATIVAGSLSLSGVISGDTVSMTGTTAHFASALVGTQVVTCDDCALDGADRGNYVLTTPVTTTASISAWSLTGFYEPVGLQNTVLTAPGGILPVSGTWNTIKGGQTVPLKFNLYATSGGSPISSVSSVQSMSLTPVGCTSGAEDTVSDLVSTGGTALRWDGVQFIQNWSSPKGAGKCYRVTMTAADGSSLSALFKTK